MRNGTSGEAERSSIAVNAASSAAESPSSPTVCSEPQPAFRASTSVYTRSESPAVTATAPATSKARRSPVARLSSIRRGANSAARMPIGKLTYSTHSQPGPEVRTPPRSTPAAPPEPATPPQMPSARLRSAPSVKVFVTIESAAGDRSAAPRPWTARAAISHASLWASPPASDATANTISPAMNTRRRPSRSARRPPSRRKPPKVSTYALTTQESESCEKCSARPIEGSATLTMDASSTTTNCAVASRPSAIQRRRSVESVFMATCS